MTVRIKNLKMFNREIKQFGVEVVPQEHLKLQKRIAVDLLRRIVFRTPVDTGRARGNWQVARGGGSDSPLEKFDKSGGATFAAGASAIGSTKEFSLITIFNNVNYINILEGGSSSQFPSGMVAVSLAETEAQFR
jgi:hypothetical protein